MLLSLLLLFPLGLCVNIIKLTGTETLSTDTENFLNANMPLSALGYSHNQRNQYELITVDKNSPFHLDSTEANGDASIAPEEIKKIVKGTREFNLSGYSMTYNYSDNTYFLPNDSSPLTNLSEINCIRQIPDAYANNVNSSLDMIKYSKRAHYYHHSLGLNGKTLYDVYKGKLLSDDSTKDYLKDNVLDFWVIRNQELTEYHLIVVTADSPLKLVV